MINSSVWFSEFFFFKKRFDRGMNWCNNGGLIVPKSKWEGGQDSQPLQERILQEQPLQEPLQEYIKNQFRKNFAPGGNRTHDLTHFPFLIYSRLYRRAGQKLVRPAAQMRRTSPDNRQHQKGTIRHPDQTRAWAQSQPHPASNQQSLECEAPTADQDE
jgi:hypothetical protein